MLFQYFSGFVSLDKYFNCALHEIERHARFFQLGPLIPAQSGVGIATPAKA